MYTLHLVGDVRIMLYTTTFVLFSSKRSYMVYIQLNVGRDYGTQTNIEDYITHSEIRDRYICVSLILQMPWETV